MGDRQRTTRPEEMATTSTTVATVPAQLTEEPVERMTVITLRPARTQPRKKVVWTEDTVDNEHMNKKKSKCCCIYEKPRGFGESDSEESEDECEHCFGHVERRHAPADTHAHTHTHTQDNTAPETPATITLEPPTPAPTDKPPTHTE